jgi:hypothetical protein
VCTKKIIYIYSFVVCFSCVYPENFIVQEADSKKFSKNELKEEIGREIKEALNNCAELNKQLGKIQIQLSEIQKQLFEKVEELIDNKQPFKKASRANLTETFKTIKSVKSELTAQAENVKKLGLQINGDNCLKKS